MMLRLWPRPRQRRRPPPLQLLHPCRASLSSSSSNKAAPATRMHLPVVQQGAGLVRTGRPGGALVRGGRGLVKRVAAEGVAVVGVVALEVRPVRGRQRTHLVGVSTDSRTSSNREAATPQLSLRISLNGSNRSSTSPSSAATQALPHNSSSSSSVAQSLQPTHSRVRTYNRVNSTSRDSSRVHHGGHDSRHSSSNSSSLPSSSSSCSKGRRLPSLLQQLLPVQSLPCRVPVPSCLSSSSRRWRLSPSGTSVRALGCSELKQV